MASITKRGSFWRVQIRTRGHNSISRSFDTKIQAQTWSKDIESQMARGIYRCMAEAENTTLHEALDRYYAEISSQKSHPAQELQRVKHWQRHPLARRYLATLRGTDFALYRDDRRAEGRAESTIRLELQLVSHLFEICRKEWGMEGLINPMNNIRKPGSGTSRERRLMPGEFDLIFNALQASGNPWAAPAFVLAIDTSLRQGMLFKLSRSWLDATKGEHNGRVFFIPEEHRAKGNKGVPPFVPLTLRAAQIVANMQRSPDGNLFGCTQNAVVMVWKKALKSARAKYLATTEHPVKGFLEDLRWHDLRHEAASRMFEKGLHPLEVSSITGHKSLTMLKRYTHLQPSQLLSKIG